MIHLTRTCLYVVVSLALAATCLAQGKRARPSKREPAPKRAPSVAVMVPEGPVGGSPPEVSKIGQATVEFEPHLNLTSVRVEFQEVYRRGEATADFRFDFAFSGREPARQGEVSWWFSSDWEIFRVDAPLAVEADGKRLSFRPEREPNFPDLRMGNMDFATLELLANSKQARLGIGRVKFVLTESQREALRDMLKIFETPKRQ